VTAVNGFFADRIIVHRANFVQKENDSIYGIRTLAQKGFKHFEIDLWVNEESKYKFCHPRSDTAASEPRYSFDDPLLQRLIEHFPHSLWFIDIKFLEHRRVPRDLIKHIAENFPLSVVFVSESDQLLLFAQRLKLRIAQVIRSSVCVKTKARPEFIIVPEDNIVKYPEVSKIVICDTIERASRLLKDNENVAFAMIENPLLP